MLNNKIGFKTYIFLTLLICSSSFNNIKAQFRLPALLTDNMVLQQNDSVLLWGWAQPSEKIAITTSWNNKTDTASTDSYAQWKLKVKTPAAGGPYTINFKGYGQVKLENVMIGEVWVCSGQSNMEWTYYAGVDSLQPELNKHTQQLIRFFKVPKQSSEYPLADVKSKWLICDSTTLKEFSAVGYFFGKQINQNLNVPIGLISTAWGGTSAETWTPATTIAADKILQEAAQKQKVMPWCPAGNGILYNAMINPLLQYPIAGAIWYQGEANTVAPNTYGKLLTTMVDAWRAGWKKDFPFYLVQIAPFTYGPGYSAAIIREQQTKAATHNNMGMVVISDVVGDTTDIHPRNKKDVGKRLAAMALSNHYKKTQPVDYAPLQSFEVVKDKMLLSFSAANAPITIKGTTATALFIAGDDKVFHPATAKWQQGKLVVWSKWVKKPVAVRYGFCNACVGNLFTANALPVNAFRTDNWEAN